MTMTAEDRSAHAVSDYARQEGAITGIRPRRRDSVAVARPGPQVGSAWAPCAAVAWLLALTPCAVIAVKFGFLVTMGLAVLQAALISMVLMRDAWERRIHLLVIGVGVLLSAFLMAMIAFDRSEYRADVERFDTTIRGGWESGAD